MQLYLILTPYHFPGPYPVILEMFNPRVKALIEFSQDSTFDIIVDTATISVNDITMTFDLTGELFWRVRTDDVAGNNSDYSIVHSFIIN